MKQLHHISNQSICSEFLKKMWGTGANDPNAGVQNFFPHFTPELEKYKHFIKTIKAKNLGFGEALSKMYDTMGH